MFRSRGKVVSLGLVLALLLAVGITLGVSAQVPSATPALTAQVSGTTTGGGVSYSATLVNTSDAAVSNIYIAVKVPEGLTAVKASETPAGAWFRGVENGTAVWLASTVAANGKLGPFTYQATVSTPPTSGVSAWVHWNAPSEGVATSSEVTYAQAVLTNAPRRGCSSCHVPGGIDANGKYSLLWEAEERAEARGGKHPTMLPDGSALTFKSGADACLQCHKPGTGSRAGKGAAAPLALRDIVHPAHMFSSAFKEHYNGGCFTCHNVAGNGDFELLSEKVDVNEKGVPNPAKLPIPGALPPSEDNR